MGVKINLHQQFLRGDADTPTVAEVNGNTVGQCLNHLVRRFPAIKQEILDEDGKILDYLCVFVNGEEAFPDELSKPVKDGDEIHIIPLIGGG